MLRCPKLMEMWSPRCFRWFHARLYKVLMWHDDNCDTCENKSIDKDTFNIIRLEAPYVPSFPSQSSPRIPVNRTVLHVQSCTIGTLRMKQTDSNIANPDFFRTCVQ